MKCKIWYVNRRTLTTLVMAESSVKSIRGGKMKAMRHAPLGYDVHLQVGDNFTDSRLSITDNKRTTLLGWSEGPMRKTKLMKATLLLSMK